MTLKTARTKLRLTEIESLTQTGRARAREAANEAGARFRDSGSGRPASGTRIERSAGWSSAKEGDAMPYRDSGSDPTIGEELTQAREAAGLEIADVAAQLRIRREFLAALEDGRPDLLPGKTYAIGYVRTYAAFLGLDVEQAVTRFKQEAAGLDQRTQLVFPSPAPEGRVPGVGLMFASVLLAGLAYGGWYWLSERGMSVYDMVPDVPERLAALIEGQNPPTTLPAPATTAPMTDSAAQPTAVAGAPQAPAANTTTQSTPATEPSAPDSTYTAANPTSVPVTARSTSGETASTPLAPLTDPAPTPTVATSAITRPTTDAPAADRAPVAPVTVTPTPAPAGAVAAVDPAPTSPADMAEDTPAADPEPNTTALASAAPAPTQALAAAQPLAAAPSPSPVPSAPRLSGLIGASEAAVPGSAANPVPAAIERVVVRATGESWVQVRAQDGTTLFTRVLRNGDVYRVPDRPGLTLATGNAGALEIVVDGNPAPSLGTFGEVVRNIALDPSRLAAGTAIAGRN